MGIFSRRKNGPTGSQPSLSRKQSHTSLNSRASSIKSPSALSADGRPFHRSSGATVRTGSPGTPVTPFSMTSPSLPKIDMVAKSPDPQLDPAGYLRSLGAVRERCKIITDKALKNQLKHFDVDMTKFPDVVTFVANIIKRDYDAPFANIPAHGRQQHFNVGGRDRVSELLAKFPDDVDNTEKCKRMIDLVLVSVLLDAGAGTQWCYKSKENGRAYRRSEGIAVASLEMYNTGLFSSNPDNKYQVDKGGLKRLTVQKLAEGLQSGPGNEMAGMDGRSQLLLRLSQALEEKREFFGEDGRPGNMLDHILSHPSTQASNTPIVAVPVLWNVLMNGLAPIWPASRTTLDGISLGDAWPCESMPQVARSPTTPTFSPFPQTEARSQVQAWEGILPFHKLTQWLAYSLMQPMQNIMKVHFAGQELLTGLPEYRNGGLFVDLGVLTLRRDDEARGLRRFLDDCEKRGARAVEVAPMFEPSDDVVVEWRGVTVGFLDKLCADVNVALRDELAGHELSLAQVLEAGSWKGGREIAEVSRPNTKQPPILIESDGTVF